MKVIKVYLNRKLILKTSQRKKRIIPRSFFEEKKSGWKKMNDPSYTVFLKFYVCLLIVNFSNIAISILIFTLFLLIDSHIQLLYFQLSQQEYWLFFLLLKAIANSKGNLIAFTLKKAIIIAARAITKEKAIKARNWQGAIAILGEKIFQILGAPILFSLTLYHTWSRISV